jgi:hypothetical protein
MRRAPGEFARLNHFQEVMARWEAAHPYNAGQVVRLDGRVDVARLREAIQIACRDAGVGTLVLDSRRRRYRYDRAEPIPLEEIAPTEVPAEALRRALTESFNTGFPEGPHHPIRWSILEDRGTDSSFLITVWRHLAADEMSVRLLLRRVLNQYYGTQHPEDARPFTMPSPALARTSGVGHRTLSQIAALARGVWLRLAVRAVYRFQETALRGEGTHIHLVSLPSGLAGHLATWCRTHRVAPNDLFLAVLGKVLARSTAQARAQGSKRSLGLATAVCLRRLAPPALARSFSVVVGHWVTFLHRPDAELPALLRQIATQTRAEKGARRSALSPWGFILLALVSRWRPFRHDGRWYAKMYRLSGGVSNVRSSTEWFGDAGRHLREYYLVSPPGPVVPLVVASATLDDKVCLSLVARDAALSAAEADTLLAQLCAELRAIADRDQLAAA